MLKHKIETSVLGGQAHGVRVLRLDTSSKRNK